MRFPSNTPKQKLKNKIVCTIDQPCSIYESQSLQVGDIHKLAENSRLNELKLAIDRETDIDKTDMMDRPPLMLAAIIGYKDCVQLLIDKGVQDK